MNSFLTTQAGYTGRICFLGSMGDSPVTELEKQDCLLVNSSKLDESKENFQVRLPGTGVLQKRFPKALYPS